MCCGKSVTSAPPSSRRLPPEAIIASGDDVRALIPDLRLLTLRRKKIVLRLPGLDPAEQARLSGQIARHYSVCGCEQGRLTGILTLLAYVTLLIADAIPFRELGWGRTVGYYFLCSFFTMLCGKIYGLWHARRSLAQLANRLPQPPTSNPV